MGAQPKDYWVWVAGCPMSVELIFKGTLPWSFSILLNCELQKSKYMRVSGNS
jgi:hypothetical protein